MRKVSDFSQSQISLQIFPEDKLFVISGTFDKTNFFTQKSQYKCFYLCK